MAKRARKGQLTERQIAYLRARARQSIASKVTIIDPAKITLKAVDRILAAVASSRVRYALKDNDRASLAADLSRARFRYWSGSIDDKELTQDRKLKHLTKLKSAAEKLLKVLLDFEAKGRPGWLLLREGARLHARQIKEELHELRLKRQSLIEKKRESFGGQTDNQNLQALDAELNWHERAHFAYQDLGARGILYKAELAVEALVRWYDLPHQALTQKRIDELLKSPSDHPGHVKALRFLIKDLSAIYQKHFGRKFSLSRQPDGGKLGGPAMRFTCAVLDQFEIKNEDGNSFSPEGIRRYWPTKS